MKIIYNTTDNVMSSPTPVGEFRIMIDKAKEIKQKNLLSDYSQIIVVWTINNGCYCGMISVNDNAEDIKNSDLWNVLTVNDDVEIKSIVCMWPDEYFDMPSYTFRKMLCDLNQNNANAEMILSGQDCFVYRKIIHTFT